MTRCRKFLCSGLRGTVKPLMMLQTTDTRALARRPDTAGLNGSISEQPNTLGTSPSQDFEKLRDAARRLAFVHEALEHLLNAFSNKKSAKTLRNKRAGNSAPFSAVSPAALVSSAPPPSLPQGVNFSVNSVQNGLQIVALPGVFRAEELEELKNRRRNTGAG